MNFPFIHQNTIKIGFRCESGIEQKSKEENDHDDHNHWRK
jgi:hypothetical protein